MKLSKNDKVLRPIIPNVGVEYQYRRRLWDLIGKMHTDTVAAIKKNYSDPATMAHDADDDNVDTEQRPLVQRLRQMFAELEDRWFNNFDEAADRLADYFATDIQDRVDRVLRAILKKGGFSVRFRMTPAMRQALQATIAGNVSLIRTIPRQYHSQVQELVMRSVTTGRDLGYLTKQLYARYDITRRRAAFIARDQNNKATSAMTRARQLDLNITKAIWKHSHAKKEPRPTHLANDNKVYDTRTGWYDPAERRYIFPGELIQCGCMSRSVIPGFAP